MARAGQRPRQTGGRLGAQRRQVDWAHLEYANIEVQTALDATRLISFQIWKTDETGETYAPA